MATGGSDREDGVAGEMIAWINGERERQQLPPLQVEDGLTASAQVRATELRGDFSHDRPESTLEALLDEEGVDWTIAAETLARVKAPTPAAAVDEAYHSLMESTDHRGILLSPSYSRIGVASGQAHGDWLFVELVAD